MSQLIPPFDIYDSFDDFIVRVEILDDRAREIAAKNDGYICDSTGEEAWDSSR